jgi:hypothetical protein
LDKEDLVEDAEDNKEFEEFQSKYNQFKIEFINSIN